MGGVGAPVARWQLRPVDTHARDRLVRALGISPLLAHILMHRGLADPEAALIFLDVRPERLSSPFALAQMDRAVERLVRALRQRSKIVVYGDYDADGVTATAQLVRVLRRGCGLVDFYVPDRQTEGYGLHPAAVAALAAGGAQVLVAVDCGITATLAADVARAAGMDLIILDHHEPVGPLPHATVLVNPKLTGSSTDFCAAGLAFQACRGVLTALGEPEIDHDAMALAALGTVADAVDLLGDNRIIVGCGLEELRRSTAPGMVALREVTAVQAPLRVRDISHTIAPRINAAGRLARASEAVRLLTSDDLEECRRLAADLDRLNQERRALCDRVLADAVEEIEAGRLQEAPAIVLASEGWHPGVVGIVASQLVERYYRPAVLIAVRDGVGRGSARSIPPLHLIEAMAEASQHLISYGGHAMAAGLAVAADTIPLFRAAFLEAVGGLLRPDDLSPVLLADAEIALAEVTPALVADLQRLAPHGMGNTPPVFLTRGVRAVGTRLVGGGAHLRLVVSDGERTVEAIAFQLGDLVELLAFTQARIDLAYGIETHRWREEETVQLVVADLATPGVDLAAITSDTGLVLARLFERADDYLNDRRRELEDVPGFHTKVVGVTFEGRQAVLPQVRPGERLRLIRDPANPRDPHAIKVCLADGRQLGFVRAALAALLAPAIDAGASYAASATALTGGGERAWGLNVYVAREPDASGLTSGPLPGPIRQATERELQEWLAARLLRGRGLTAAQRDLLAVLQAGGRAAARLGPGRSLPATAMMAAAARIARGAGPVLVVLPRSPDVDAWSALVGPWLRALGLRWGAVHAAVPIGLAARTNGVWDRGGLDVLLASAVWVDRQQPRAGSVIAVCDALSGDDDVVTLRTRYGERLCLIAGPIPQDRLEIIAGADGRHLLVPDSMPRTNLRLVDRRGKAGIESLVIAPNRRPERTLVVTANAPSSVALARTLRARHRDMADEIAYCHAGLPASLRRVLEDLFAAGQLTVLVTGAYLAHPSLPADVARVVAMGLAPDRLLAADILGSCGLAGQVGTVELCYSPEILADVQAGLAARFPSRETLGRCYHKLRERFHSGLDAGSGGAPATLDDPALSAETVAACITIFEEAGVLTLESGEGSSMRYTVIGPGDRADLDRSPRYREGARVRAAWSDVRTWATGPASGILAEIAQP